MGYPEVYLLGLLFECLQGPLLSAVNVIGACRELSIFLTALSSVSVSRGRRTDDVICDDSPDHTLEMYVGLGQMAIFDIVAVNGTFQW